MFGKKPAAPKKGLLDNVNPGIMLLGGVLVFAAPVIAPTIAPAFMSAAGGAGSLGAATVAATEAVTMAGGITAGVGAIAGPSNPVNSFANEAVSHLMWMVPTAILTAVTMGPTLMLFEHGLAGSGAVQAYVAGAQEGLFYPLIEGAFEAAAWLSGAEAPALVLPEGVESMDKVEFEDLLP